MHFHTRLKGILRFAALLWVWTQASAALPDGPYVLRSANGWDSVSVEVTGDVVRKQVRSLPAGASVTVPAVGAVPSFVVKLREPAANAPDQVRTAKGAPLFVVGDTHGEYETLVATLRAHRVIGDDLRWKFARGHLVVLGDVFDRGPNHLEILWLLYELEAQAAKAGGGVDLVLGNHEVMALRGDLRYLNTKYVESARVLGVASYSDLFAASSLLGQWLRSRPTLLKVDDYLCLHAGVSRALIDSRLTITDINATVRSVLADEPGQGAVSELVLGTLGPLWYRGYFPEHSDFPAATAEDLDLALETFGARRMLIGHTIVPAITPLYGGKVIDAQARPFAALLIRPRGNRDPELWQAGVDGSLGKLQNPAKP
jgi:calcineurin-like phosphoesterase family protein